MRFLEVSDPVNGIMFLWLIGIFVLGLYNLFHAIRVKQTIHIVISAFILVLEYLLLQMISELLHGKTEFNSTSLSQLFGRIHIGWWCLGIATIMGISIRLAAFFKHWKEEHITPMSVKDSIDKLHAGLCYWEEGGRIILSNKMMDEICLAVSGELLLNGQKFFESIEEECVSLPDGTIKYFFHNLVEFDDKQIHELIAADVTELYKKNMLLEQETLNLQKMNESLRRYNQNIEEVVRKQEILDAKVYIHDEMNRLMLVTTAMTETALPEEEFESVLTLWRNNAVLLGNEAEKNETDIDISEIDRLADLLGIHILWTGKQLVEIPKKYRELLVVSVREAIANAVKHAQAEHIAVDMNMVEQKLIIAISNDGKRPTGKVNEGGGLSNIRRMVEEHNGTMKAFAKEQFELQINLPC